VSSAKGEWELAGISPQFELYATATHPRYGVAWTAIGEKTSSSGVEERKAKVFTDAVLKMRPMTTLSGRIVDEATGQFPVLIDQTWPEPPDIGAVYAEGATATRYNTFARGNTKAPIAPDGTFTLPVAVGYNVVWPSVPFFEPVERGASIQVGREGSAGVVIKVRRQPYFLVRFDADDPTDLKGFTIRDITNNLAGVSYGDGPLPPSRLWAKPARKWGEEMKVRISYGGGVTLETTFTAQPDNWPQAIKLPSRPAANATPP
jgi:hypothetical protein